MVKVVHWRPCKVKEEEKSEREGVLIRPKYLDQKKKKKKEMKLQLNVIEVYPLHFPTCLLESAKVEANFKISVFSSVFILD